MESTARRHRNETHRPRKTLAAFVATLLVALAAGALIPIAATPAAATVVGSKGSVAAGWDHACYASPTVTMTCWGSNANGGLGTSGSPILPTAVPGLSSGVHAVAAGNHFSCAVTAAGGAKCWGANNRGQLGNGSSNDSSTPTDVSGLTSGVVDVEAGFDHACALTSGGGAKCWGNNGSGQLGNGITGGGSATPVDVSGLTSGVASISVGDSSTCAVTTGGAAKCWGYGGGGALGDGTFNSSSVPVDVQGLGFSVSAVDVGSNVACALRGGGAKCWGSGVFLGNGSTSSATPVDVTGVTFGATAISVGAISACAVLEDGSVKCWGDDTYGELGNGTTGGATTAVDVIGLSGSVAEVSVGALFACAVTNATTWNVQCWGQHGALGDGTNTDSSVPIGVRLPGTKCVSTLSGTWSGTTISTQLGGTGTWSDDISFFRGGNSSTTAPDSLAGPLTSVGPSGPLDGPATGTVACDGRFNVQVNAAGGRSISFSAGVLTQAQTVSGSYQVTNGATVLDAGTFTGHLTTPSIASLSPTNGSFTGGTLVTITGVNLDQATDVIWDGDLVPFTVKDPNTITLTSPPGRGQGIGSVLVQVAPGNSAANFVYTGDYSQAVLSKSPAGYWRLGDPDESTIVDATGNGLNARASSGCVDIGEPGALAGDPDTAMAQMQDCLGGAVTVNPDSTPGSARLTGDFTAEAWVKPRFDISIGETATSALRKKWRTIISSRWPDGRFGPNGDFTFDFKLAGTTAPGGQQLYADVGDGSQFMVHGGVPFAWQPDHWYHVAVTVAENSGNVDVTFFVNGASIGTLSAPMTADPVAFDQSTHPLVFGENARFENVPDAEYLEGTFDEVAIYPRALTASDLRTDYLLGVNGPTMTASVSASAATVNATQAVLESALPPSALEGGSPSPAGNAASAPLRSIPLASSPLRSIPLRSIPLRSIALQSVPGVQRVLAATLLSDVPITYPSGCTGNGCTGWSGPNGLLRGTTLQDAPLSSLTLSDVLANPTASARFEALPFSALDVSSSPLRSIPLGAIALSGVPLRSIPLPGAGSTDTSRLAAWCTLISQLGSSCTTFGIVASNPSTAEHVDLLTLSLGGVPIESVPLRSIPLRSIDLASSPLRSIPLRSIDAASTPLRSIPLRSIPLRSIPLGAIPLRSITVLSNVVDCKAPLDCSTTSTATLGDAEAAGDIKSTATLADLATLDSTPLRSIPLRSINMASSPLRSIPLRSIDMPSSSPLRSIPLRSIPLRSIPLGAIPLRSIPVLSNVVTCTTPLDCSSTSTATLGDAEAAGQIKSTAVLSDLANLDAAPLRSIPLRSIVLQFAPLRSIPLRSIDAVASVVDCTLVDCRSTSTATLGNASDAGAILTTATLDQLGSFVGTALGDLSASNYNNATLDDLGPYLNTLLGDLLAQLDPNTPGYTEIYLTDLLRGFMPPTSYPWQNVDVAALPVASLGTGGDTVTYTASLAWSGASTEKVQTLLALPPSLAYVPGTAQIDGAPVADPGTVSGALSWSLDLTPGPHTIAVQARAVAGLGPATVSLTVQPDNQPSFVASSTVDVVDPYEPNDNPSTPSQLTPGQLALSYVNKATDSDWWSVNVAEGDELALSLSNLPADYDLALFSPAAPALQSGTPVPVPSVVDTAPSITNSAQPPAGGNEVDVTPPSGYQLYALSANRDKTNETMQTPPLAAGTYLVHVSGFNGAWSQQPYVLRAQLLPSANPSCSISYPNAAPAPAALPTSLPSGVNTIFLVNTQRLSAAYGSAAEQQVMASLGQVAGDSAAGVVGAVVPLDGDAATRSAYDAWSANACSISGANGVVRSVTNLLNSIRAAHPTVKNVVIVGGDDQIPFARLADGAVVSNERDYGASTFPGEENVLSSALSEGYYLSDDPLTATQPLAVGSATLYVPQLAVGRLVETPAEIENALNRFTTSGGVLNASAALSTGYSFLTGGANAVATNLAKVSGRTVSTLINDSWTAAQLEQALTANPPRGLDSVNAHFDFSRALSAHGDSAGNQTDLFDTTYVHSAASSFSGRLLFSMGCHGGLAINSAEVAASGIPSVDDWAKTFADTGSLWVANTGYGYGDSDIVAYSARLMAGFANELDGSTSVGTALVDAKQSYSAGNTLLSPYDVKALMESTFYGLPMYHLNNAPPPPPTPPTPPATFTDPATGLTAANVSVGTPSPLHFDAVNTGNGTYYRATSDPQTQTTEFRPIEPLTSVDVTQPSSGGGLALVAHGALITALHSTDQTLTNPAVSTPGVDSSTSTLSTITQDPFPATLARVAGYQTSDTSGTAQRQRLDLVVGQYIPGSTPTNGVQRLFDSASIMTFYKPASAQYFVPPTIAFTNGLEENGQIEFDATVNDSGAAIKRVLVLYTDAQTPGVWGSLDLTGADGTHFSATAPATASGHVRYFVQAVDDAGNVGIGTMKGLNFPSVVPTAPSITSASSAGFVVGQPGSFQLGATGSPAPTLTETGTLPSGLTFDPTGAQLSGTPAPGTAGAYHVAVTATSPGQAPARRDLSIFVAGAPQPSAPKPYMFSEPVSVPMASSPEVVNVPVALSWPSTSQISVHYQTFNKSALAGRDYEAATGTLTFAPGQTLAGVPVTIDPDTQAGPNLLFTVKLSSASGASVSYPQAPVTLVNSAGPLTVSVDDQFVQPASSGSVMRFTVSLSSPVAVGHTVSVPYATADGSAHAGTDFTASSGTLTFTAGQSSQQVLVPILDASVTTTRTFSLKLSKSTGTTLAVTKGVGTIAPTGTPPKPYIVAQPVAAAMASSSQLTEVAVALSWPSTSPVTAHYQTFNKSALAGRDFEAASGTLTFAPGQTLAHIPATVDADGQAGPNLFFTVKLSSVTGASIGSTMAVVTLVDPLGPMTVSVSDPLASPTSSGFEMPFTVSLSSPVVGRTITVPYATAGGSPGIDYTATSGTLTFVPGQSSQQVLVPILDLSVPTARSFSLKLGKSVGVTPGKVIGKAIIAPG